MSKFITSSLWNFVANFIVRAMSIVTFPFLARYYLREDISIFKSFQAFVLILMAIIPIGTNILYLSDPQETRERRWNLFFHISIIISLVFSVILFFSDTISGFFIRNQLDGYLRILLILLPLVEGLKGIIITKLSALLDFKGISLALIIKQLLLYAAIIFFAFINPALMILIVIIFFSELLELIMLYQHATRMNLNLLPNRSYKRMELDKPARQFIAYSGIGQILLTFAIQFPTIFVVIVLGETLAPEFQLPFAAVALPVSLVMNSIARVSFPHYSNLREDQRITSSLFSLLFPVTFILFPVLIGIHFFAQEIVHFFFDETWQFAIFAMKLFPLLMMAYILGIPSTFVSNIKQKPYINLIYSIALLVTRMLTIYFGYKLAGFHGTILLFVIGDIVVRMIRLQVDMSLLGLPIKRFFIQIRYNLISNLILFSLTWLIFYITQQKIISFLIALIIAVGLNYYQEQDRVIDITKKVCEAIWKK